ncbi:hypothetical protein QUF61_03260 [Candidatus Venteria ishoeyi]|uniref:hypothetical protein n=1 Tax=Candidatus Venteria ishoeyi TaxID=1899563 RepID=UPI0025A52F7B|nr:hypothetical protein [Candidatus Venteria ishoeyi]MDM8545492.1 hypothetical protein [Candidatus Venteria ishoeyi]
MNNNRPHKQQAEYAIRVLQKTLGSANLLIVSVMIVVLVAVGIFINGVYEMLTLFDNQDWQQLWSWKMIISLGTFPIMFIILLYRARVETGQIRPIVIQDDKPAEVKGLILFLSPPGRDEQTIKAINQAPDKKTHNMTDKVFRESFSGPWRMPIEAINYHLGRLKTIIIIPSKTTETQTRKQIGTIKDMEDFRQLICNIHPFSPDIKSISELKPEYASGIDFEDIRELADVTNYAYEYLQQKDMSLCDIIVDITGGQKPSSAAATAIALMEGRQFQYVSMHDYKVRAYDVTYLN